MSQWLHHSGGTVCEPTDIAVNKRHLDMLLAHMTLSDKPFMGSVTEPERAADSVEMCRILFGAENVGPNCYMTSLININSPLVFDSTMMGALEVYARAGQAVIVSPFIVGGAMAPVSGGGDADAGAGRGDDRHRLCAAGQPGVPGDLRGVRDLDRHELGGADLRDARGVEDPLGRRAAGAAAEPAVPLGRRRCAARSCRTRRRPTRAPTRCRRRCSAGSTSCCTPAAGSRAGWSSGYEKFVLDADQLGRAAFAGRGDRPQRERAGDGRDRARSGRAGTTSAARTPRRTSRPRSGGPRCFDYRPFETWAEAGAPDSMALANARVRQMLARVRGAGDRSGDRRGAAGVRRPAQGVGAGRLRVRPEGCARNASDWYCMTLSRDLNRSERVARAMPRARARRGRRPGRGRAGGRRWRRGRP